jgi:hypothetical protein
MNPGNRGRPGGANRGGENAFTAEAGVVSPDQLT